MLYGFRASICLALIHSLIDERSAEVAVGPAKIVPNICTYTRLAGLLCTYPKPIDERIVGLQHKADDAWSVACLQPNTTERATLHGR